MTPRSYLSTTTRMSTFLKLLMISSLILGAAAAKGKLFTQLESDEDSTPSPYPAFVKENSQYLGGSLLSHRTKRSDSDHHTSADNSASSDPNASSTNEEESFAQLLNSVVNEDFFLQNPLTKHYYHPPGTPGLAIWYTELFHNEKDRLDMIQKHKKEQKRLKRRLKRMIKKHRKQRRKRGESLDGDVAQRFSDSGMAKGSCNRRSRKRVGNKHTISKKRNRPLPVVASHNLLSNYRTGNDQPMESQARRDWNHPVPSLNPSMEGRARQTPSDRSDTRILDLELRHEGMFTALSTS